MEAAAGGAGGGGGKAIDIFPHVPTGRIRTDAKYECKPKVYENIILLNKIFEYSTKFPFKNILFPLEAPPARVATLWGIYYVQRAAAGGGLHSVNLSYKSLSLLCQTVKR